MIDYKKLNSSCRYWFFVYWPIFKISFNFYEKLNKETLLMFLSQKINKSPSKLDLFELIF